MSGSLLGEGEASRGCGKAGGSHSPSTRVCLCARAPSPSCVHLSRSRVLWGVGTWDLWWGRLVEEVWGLELETRGVGGGGLNGHFTVVAEALVRTLASYEVVTPARVNEFGEVFPQSHHFSRRKRSSEAPEPTPFRTHYRISAYGQLFQLNLSADAAFLAESYTEVHLGAPARGAEERRAVSPGLRHCFYRGQVNAREDHVAVFSLCGGLVSALRSFDVFLRSSLKAPFRQPCNGFF